VRLLSEARAAAIRWRRISGEFEAVGGACRCRSDLLLMCFNETAEQRPEDDCRVRGPRRTRGLGETEARGVWLLSDA
jgi:hypothetical protein